MINKIIGLAMVLVVAVGVIFLASAAAGTGPGGFISAVSFVWVVGIAAGLTLMKRDVAKDGLFPVLKHNLIFAGYTGPLVGLIMMLGGIKNPTG